MYVEFALTSFAQVSGIGETLISGIVFALTEGGRTPFEFQTAIDIPSMPAVQTDACAKYIISNPRILQQLNDCLLLESGKPLEFMYCPIEGFKVALT